LPLSEFLQTTQDITFVNLILRGELVLDPISDECDALKFQQWEREFRENESTNGVAARLEIQARLMRLAHRLGNRSSTSRAVANLPRADQIACYIARHYYEPLTAQSIAEAVGVHPNYAMSLFRETFGTTMTSFITQHRISHAQRLLATTDDSILSIAMSAGFQSLSRFNEAFKTSCGRSPRDYRKSHRPDQRL
jgi:AraC-like DNA-binding protein